MCRRPFEIDLPPEASPAVRIVQALVDAGYQALLAGGCVRDLLLGNRPSDYDVATDAPPQTICRLFRKTRKVGVKFGVVLVRKRGRWVEVATFRSDGQYLDGRRPSEVHFCDAPTDARRRDFTINGMFLDPLRREIIDYVGGSDDLAAGLIRAIGAPEQRFAEDYLRLLRAVRFAARLDFEIEPRTWQALCHHASRLREIAPERIRDELERMLSHPGRARAVELLRSSRLLEHLWPDARWNADHLDHAQRILARLPAEAPFTLACAVLLADRPEHEIHAICRRLTCSNEQRLRIAWLALHHRDLDDPAQPTLAELKRLMADAGFAELRAWAQARYLDMPDADGRRQRLQRRIAAIAPERIAPPPLVTGDDLAARGVPPGPVYKQILDAVYTAQLDERIADRQEALALLERLLAERS